MFPIAINQFLCFTLVLVRVSTLVMIAPIYGTNEVPAKIRVLLAVALAMLVAPLHWNELTQLPDNIAGYLVLVGAEALVGLSLGLGVLILFSGIQVAGHVISQMSGLQLADVFSPGLNDNVPVISQLLYFVALAVFVTIGGHRSVMEALLDTYVYLPLGHGGFSRSMSEAMVSLLSESFVLGVRAAAPAMVALLLATLILGLISRTLPQLNVMALGFGISAIATLVTLGMSMTDASWLFQEHLQSALDTIVGALR